MTGKGTVSKRRGQRVDSRTGNSRGDAKHVRLYEWMMRSNAWHGLSSYARCLYIELCQLYNGNNNGELYLSEREAGKRVGCNAKTASKAFSELIGWGFILPSVLGGFNRKQRHATCWVLTEFSYGNNLPTKDFMRHGVTERNNTRHHYAGQTAPQGGADALIGMP